MANERGPGPANEAAARAAAEAVHGRLALVSCAVWTIGVLAVYLLSPEDMRDMRAMAAAFVLLVPAGLVWLARRRLVAAEARRRAAAAAVPLGRDDAA